MFISNTMERVDAEGDVCWALRIEGKLETYGRHGRLANRKLSHYFDAVLVEVQMREGEPEVIEWRNSPTQPESDGFEVRRRGIPFSPAVKIILQLANQPERFKVAQPLAQTLGLEYGTRPEVILAVWQYIKLHKLQESEEKKNVLNDDAFKRAFGVEQMTFGEIPEVITPHLLPLDPIVIDYQLDLVHGGGLVVHDVEVELEDPSKSARPAFTANGVALQREMGLVDQKMAECVSAIKTSMASTRILDAFAKDPVACTSQLLAKQSADYEVVVGDVSISPEDLNRAALFDTDDTAQAVQIMLQSMKL
jgi:SWI/SNF-related matrix-associated actin-dependent regulator of chromatin subfamily D